MTQTEARERLDRATHQALENFTQLQAPAARGLWGGIARLDESGPSDWKQAAEMIQVRVLHKGIRVALYEVCLCIGSNRCILYR